MAEPQIRFEDGAAYERMMGVWSGLTADIFLDWLMPQPGWGWLDVGCGTGAFSRKLIERCAPAEVQGVDPSEAQLGFARARGLGETAQFRRADAMALPFPDRSFDAAVMALVIFFVPDGQRRRRDGAGGAAWRRRRRLCLGPAERGASGPADPGRDAHDGRASVAAAE